MRWFAWLLVVVLVCLVCYARLEGVNRSGVRAPFAATKQSLRTMEGAITAYELNTGALPPTLEHLTFGETPYIERVPRDGWTHEIVYLPGRVAGRAYLLRAVGQDGKFGTRDDIDVWTMDEE